MATQGFIYFIQEATNTGPVKVGFSINPLMRLGTLKGWSPRPLKILYEFEGTRRDERFVHNHLAPHWLYGEWFEEHVSVFAALWALKFGVSTAKSLPYRGYIGGLENKVGRWKCTSRRIRQAMAEYGIVPACKDIQNYLETPPGLRRHLYSDELYDAISQFLTAPKGYGVAGEFTYKSGPPRKQEIYLSLTEQTTPATIPSVEAAP